MEAQRKKPFGLQSKTRRSAREEGWWQNEVELKQEKNLERLAPD